MRVTARITRCELGREEKRSTASGYRRGRAGWRVGSRGGQRTFASEYSSSTSELVRILASPDSGSAASDVSDRRWPSGTESLVRTAALPFRLPSVINSRRSWARPNRYLGESVPSTRKFYYYNNYEYMDLFDPPGYEQLAW